MILGRGAPVLAWLVACSTGCYTTTHTVTLTRLVTPYPVSASRLYVDAQGAVVKTAEYERLEDFTFTREIKAERHEETETALDLKPELDRIVARTQGEAVTNLHLEMLDYDAGSHEGAGKFKGAGWWLGLSVIPALGFAAMSAGNGDSAAPALGSAGFLAAVSAICFLIAELKTEPARWHLRVSGAVVKRPSLASTRPEVADPPPAALSPAEPGPVM